ncbi:MAG: hypothetical protein JRG91_19930 [Deltaproteobacteria bacterium]|nr:hypothetical protein [Deltaproteobacteria bacterium]
MMRHFISIAIAAAAIAAACGGRIRTASDAGIEPDVLADTAAEDADEDETGAEADEPPGCGGDDECIEDESCPSPGGCDGDPCRDDRCVEGTCTFIDLEGCVPDQLLEYTYAACCPTRTLVLGPGGVCTFNVEGAGESPCSDVTPAFLASLIEQARTVGFFTWGTEVCVPSSMGADFSLHIEDGADANTVTCEASSCVGELCGIIDSVWATMPSNWHDGCGCG